MKHSFLRITVAFTALVVTAALAPSIHAQQTTSGGLPGAEAWYLSTSDQSGELFIYEIGSGEPVIVLHGGPGGELTYTLPVASGLESAFRFVFYDQRGSLRSRVCVDSISMEKHVDDLDDIRQALDAERINILSHSAGTLLAFEYLERHSEHVKNLILVGALPHKNGGKYFDAEYAALWEGLNVDAQHFREREAVKAELRMAGEGDAVKTPKQEAQLRLIRQVGEGMVHVERWREQIPMRVNPDAARATRETTNFVYNHSDLLASHPFAITVINGEYDYVVGPRGSPLWKRLAATKAPNVSVVIIPDAGHNVWYDDPEGFRRALRKALSP